MCGPHSNPRSIARRCGDDLELAGGETLPDFLKRVGSDYHESGADATGDDYELSAERMEDAASSLLTLSERNDASDEIVVMARRIAKQLIRR